MVSRLQRRLRTLSGIGGIIGTSSGGGKSGVNSEVIKLTINLLFFALGVCLVAFAVLAPRGKGELGAIAKRVALFIAGLLAMVTAILGSLCFQIQSSHYLPLATR